MGEAARRKKLGLSHREPIKVNVEERRSLIRSAVSNAIADVQYMYNDMNKIKK